MTYRFVEVARLERPSIASSRKKKWLCERVRLASSASPPRGGRGARRRSGETRARAASTIGPAKPGPTSSSTRPGFVEPRARKRRDRLPATGDGPSWYRSNATNRREAIARAIARLRLGGGHRLLVAAHRHETMAATLAGHHLGDRDGRSRAPRLRTASIRSSDRRPLAEEKIDQSAISTGSSARTGDRRGDRTSATQRSNAAYADTMPAVRVQRRRRVPDRACASHYCVAGLARACKRPLVLGRADVRARRARNGD